MSSFNLSNFKGLDSNLKMYVELARTAESCERYDDMCTIMKKFVEESVGQDRDLEVEERNLLSVAFKNVIGTRRASWRTLNTEKNALGNIYIKQVEAELKETSQTVISLLEKLIPLAKTTEPKVFYLKMAGDYYRYLAESVSEGADGKNPGQEAADYYEKADKAARGEQEFEGGPFVGGLAETHPIRLGLALNYSVCYFEILKEPAKACALAKTAFDDAISKLDKLEEGDYKDSTLIMQLLRDNLTLWTSDQGSSDHMAVNDISDEEN